ncbi:MAG: hypothetical protein V1770_00110 [bacterium]
MRGIMKKLWENLLIELLPWAGVLSVCFFFAFNKKEAKENNERFVLKPAKKFLKQIIKKQAAFIRKKSALTIYFAPILMPLRRMR